MIDRKQCCHEQIPDGGRSVGFHQCGFRGVLEYGGKMYCSIHYPPNVETKRQARVAAWDKQCKNREEKDLERKRAQSELERKARGYDNLVKWLDALGQKPVFPDEIRRFLGEI